MTSEFSVENLRETKGPQQQQSNMSQQLVRLIQDANTI